MFPYSAWAGVACEGGGGEGGAPCCASVGTCHGGRVGGKEVRVLRHAVRGGLCVHVRASLTSGSLGEGDAAGALPQEQP